MVISIRAVGRSTMSSTETKGRIRGALWSGYPVEARLVEAVVKQTNWTWCQPYIGTVRKAIEVRLPLGAVYVDNQDGRALSVFLQGKAPLPGFRFIPVAGVDDDPEAKQVYDVFF
jgi:hypothetical protein